MACTEGESVYVLMESDANGVNIIIGVYTSMTAAREAAASTIHPDSVIIWLGAGTLPPDDSAYSVPDALDPIKRKRFWRIQHHLIGT